MRKLHAARCFSPKVNKENLPQRSSFPKAKPAIIYPTELIRDEGQSTHNCSSYRDCVTFWGKCCFLAEGLKRRLIPFLYLCGIDECTQAGG